MQGPMTPDELRRYAEMIVKGCIAFRRGDTLLQRVSLAHRELAVAVAEAAYRSGAAAVDVEYDDPHVYAARIRHGSKAALGKRTSWQRERMRALGNEDVAIVQVMGETEISVLSDLPPERVAEDSKRLAAGAEMARIRREGRLRGTICSWPTADWAGRVYPDLAADKAQRRLARARLLVLRADKAPRRLARDILWFCRLGPKAPPGHRGWIEHLAGLRRRAVRLTRLDLKEVRVRDHGTDLRLKIAPYSMWRGGGEKDHWGRQIAMNVPTEECFIS